MIRKDGCGDTACSGRTPHSTTGYNTYGGAPPSAGAVRRRSNTFSRRRRFGSCASVEGPLVPTSYRYRLLKGANWGIAIDVRAEALALPADPLPPGAAKVADGLWLQADVGWRLAEEELGFLKLGLRLVAGDIAKRRE